MTTGKTIALTRWTFVGKVMSLFFNMLSRLVITFLPRSKCLLISWLQSPSAVILEPKKLKSDTVSAISPSVSQDQMPWSSFSECWTLSQLFHSPLSLSSRGFLVPLHFLSQGWGHLLDSSLLLHWISRFSRKLVPRPSFFPTIFFSVPLIFSVVML